ncbi:MAG: hypothetical protein IJY89_05995, partial [Clostridia bacterium]|nr:hypothetical protein [Clostridia bacterium]
MKKVLCLLLALTMLCPMLLLSSCQKAPAKSSEPSIGDSSVPSSGQPTESPSKEDELPQVPAYSTLLGTKHLPIPDNQGSIGSCTSEGVTYTQFTVAVSQYINATDPDADWDPSSGDESCIFSPKL